MLLNLPELKMERILLNQAPVREKKKVFKKIQIPKMQNNNANKSKLLKTEVNVDRIVYAQRIGCLDSFREQRVLKAGSRLTSPL